MQPLITTSLTLANIFYLFRPIGSNDYSEVKFQYINGKLIEHHINKLSISEKIYIKEKIFVIK